MEALQNSPATNGWAPSAIAFRIRDEQSRTRHEGGSPNLEELAVYRDMLHCHARAGHAVVLGMTPELRNLALQGGFYLTSIDNNPAAHEIYGPWVVPPWCDLEARLLADWFDIERCVPQGCDAVLGDGVFGNVMGLEAHRELLRSLRNTLDRDGVLILRQALVPGDVEGGAYDAETLIRRYRDQEICDADFGLGMRLWGSYRETYDPATYLLDNAAAFARYDEWLAEGCLSMEERLIIGRYHFSGQNMLLPAQVWEDLLTETGFSFEVRKLRGKLWYEYYPLYRCYIA